MSEKRAEATDATEERTALIIDSEASYSGILERVIGAIGGYRCLWAKTETAAMAMIATQRPAVIVIGTISGNSYAMDLVTRIRQADGDVKIMLLTPPGSIESRSATLRLGADLFPRIGRESLGFRTSKSMFRDLLTKDRIELVHQQYQDIVGYLLDELSRLRAVIGELRGDQGETPPRED